MSWFKVDDGFWSNPKVLNLSDGATALWVRAGSYCCQHLTDGVVLSSLLRVLGSEDAAEELVAVGLWKSTRQGFEFHDWAEYQETSATVKKRREEQRERQRKRRASRDSSRNVTRDKSVTDTVTNGERHAPVTRECVTPDPTRPGPARPDQVKIKNTSAEPAEASDGGDGSASIAADDGGVVGFSAVPVGSAGSGSPEDRPESGGENCVSGNGGKSGGKSEGNSGTGSRKNPVRFNYPDDFNSWWSSYPKTKNKSKKNAFTEWKKAVRSVTAEKLLELTKMYAANPGQDDLRFVPDPERWLKGSRWETVAEVDADPAASRPSEDPTDPAAWLGLPSGGWSAPWGENAPAVAPVDALPVLDADVVPEDGWGATGPSEPAFWVPTAVPAPSESDHTERWA